MIVHGAGHHVAADPRLRQCLRKRGGESDGGKVGMHLQGNPCGEEGEVRELIVATNPTVEGEATAHYLAQLSRARGVHPSRLAHGVPLGGELEYVDRGTLSHAFGSRSEILDERAHGERN